MLTYAYDFLMFIMSSISFMIFFVFFFFFSSRRRHTRCALVTGVQTCALPISKGIQFRFNAPFRKVEKKADGSLSVHLGSGDPVDCDILMFATGRVPNTDGLGLEAAGVELNADGAVKEIGRAHV